MAHQPLSRTSRPALIKVADSLDKFGDGAKDLNDKLRLYTEQELETVKARSHSFSPALTVIDKWMDERNPRLIDFVTMLKSIGRNDEIVLFINFTPSIRFLTPMYIKNATDVISEKATPSQAYKNQKPNGGALMGKDPRAVETLIGDIGEEITVHLQEKLITYLGLGAKQREEYSKPGNCGQLVSLLQSRGLIKKGDASGLIALINEDVDFTSVISKLTAYQSQF